MAKVIMIQGTMSNAGKTFLCAGLCRILKQDGYRVAPFKSQNMALNSFITKDGLEMGRAQVMQAEAAGIEPDVCMNPILLKPTSNMGSQVIVNGEVYKNMSAKEYFAYKKELIPTILAAYEKLEKEYDVIVIEGAGSPAEINLKKDDLVNMGLAKMVDAPVLLVGDIDRGGVFAQLVGTIALLEPEEKERIKGLVINKFRGDKSILMPGIEMLHEKCNIPVVGVLPYENVDIDDEDSLSQRLLNGEKEDTDCVGLLHIKIIKLPHISNFTDFNALSMMKGVSVTYVDRVTQLENADLIIVPGSKNTIDDLLWMRQNGLEAVIKKQAESGTLIMGICGGFQMLGMEITDALQMESNSTHKLKGMELLPIKTCMEENKVRTRVKDSLPLTIQGAFEALAGKMYEGYEIHMGVTKYTVAIENAGDTYENPMKKKDHLVCAWSKWVFGTYLHGFFDSEEIRKAIYHILAQRKGMPDYKDPMMSMVDYKNMQYDLLADSIRKNMNMKEVYRILGLDKAELEYVKPDCIEKRSFEIITEELKGRQFPEKEANIIKRVIHTTADFEYADNLCFSEGAIEKALAALKNGACIVSDTSMVKAGIHKKTLQRLGGEAICYISDSDIVNEAKKMGVTRSALSMEKAASLKRPLIFAIGNAPTALLQLHQMIKEGKIRPELIIAVPVGFVNVVQSKELIMQTDVPFIVAKGRKGGSNVAAAICNALLYMIDNNRDL